MRLVQIHAENLLSFGTGNKALDLALDPRLTLLVGPNGGGKSNVLRAIEVGLAPFRYHSLALTGPAHGQTDPLQAEIRVLREWARQGATGPTTVQCTVDWDAPAEQALWQAFLLACLLPAIPADAGLNQAGGPANFSVAQLAAYAEALSRWDWAQLLAPFRRQTLAWTFWPREGTLHMQFHLPTFQSALESDDLIGHRWRQSPRTGNPSHPVTVDAVDDVYYQSLSEDARDRWRCVATSDHEPGELPPVDWSRIFSDPSRWVEFTPFFARTDASYPWRNPGQWPSPLQPLAEAMAKVPRYTPDPLWWWRDCVAALLTDHWLHLSRWALREPTPVSWGSPATALQEGHLGLALLRLEGQGHAGRQAVQTIQDAFFRVTGAYLGFRLVATEATPQNPSTAASGSSGSGGPATAVQAVCADASGEVPIELAGSGRAQLALLLTAQQLPHMLIGLDEPERALYPSLQTQVMREWIRQLGILAADDPPENSPAARTAQLVVVTHSPYFVVPRVSFPVCYVHRPENQATSRVVRLSPEDLRATLRTPGDALWLFADRIVLVEGPNDAWVLQHVYQAWLAAQDVHGASSSRNPAARTVLFWPAGGAAGIAAFAKVLQRLGTWWVALYDRDCCATRQDLLEAGRTAEQADNQANQNRAIWTQWADAQWSPADVEAMQHWDAMPWDARCRSFAAVQTAHRRCLFFMGTRPDDNLERLAKAWDQAGHHAKGFARLQAFADALARQLTGRGDGPAVAESVAQELAALFQLCTT